MLYIVRWHVVGVVRSALRGMHAYGSFMQCGQASRQVMVERGRFFYPSSVREIRRERLRRKRRAWVRWVFQGPRWIRKSGISWFWLLRGRGESGNCHARQLLLNYCRMFAVLSCMVVACTCMYCCLCVMLGREVLLACDS